MKAFFVISLTAALTFAYPSYVQASAIGELIEMMIKFFSKNADEAASSRGAAQGAAQGAANQIPAEGDGEGEGNPEMLSEYWDCVRDEDVARGERASESMLRILDKRDDISERELEELIAADRFSRATEHCRQSVRCDLYVTDADIEAFGFDFRVSFEECMLETLRE